jgi:hypothetical protein
MGSVPRCTRPTVTYVVQGNIVTDTEALADLRQVLAGEAFVEIPKELLRFVEGI